MKSLIRFSRAEDKKIEVTVGEARAFLMHHDYEGLRESPEMMSPVSTRGRKAPILHHKKKIIHVCLFSSFVNLNILNCLTK